MREITINEIFNRDIIPKEFNISKELLNLKFNEYEKLNSHFNNNQKLWSLFQELLNSKPEKISQSLEEFYRIQSNLYFQMAYFRRVYENSNSNYLINESIKASIKSIKHSEGYDKFYYNVTIIGSCSYSEKFRNIHIEEFLEVGYDANKCNRNNKMCVCTTAYRIRRDDNEELIFKKKK